MVYFAQGEKNGNQGQGEGEKVSAVLLSKMLFENKNKKVDLVRYHLTAVHYCLSITIAKFE